MPGIGQPFIPRFGAAGFSFGTSTPSSPTGGNTAGPASFEDIVISKALDDCTPVLFGAAARGIHFPEVKIRVVPKQALGNPIASVLLTITLQVVVLTSERFVEGTPNEIDEQLSLSYQKITITHVPSGKTFTLDRSIGSS